VLHAVDESAGPSALVLMLLEQGRPEQAQVVARSELMAHPEDANLAGVAAHGILQDDFDSQVALVRWCLERAPDAVDLHRLYQDLWPDDERQPIRQTYDSLLATNPRSAMHHYLVGRLDREGSSEALRHFRTALRLDPDYGPAHRALGYQAARDERWAEALAHYDLFAALGPAEALEATEVRLRLRRRERRSVDESLALLRETAELNPTAWWLHRLAAHISVERSPAALATQTDALLNKATAQFAIDSAAADWWNVAADLAVTAGELDAARSGLRQIPQAELRDVAVALRLALSTGATSEDRELLVTIPDWYGRLGPTQRLMALGVLETTERGKAVSEIPRHLADIAQGLAAPGQLSGRESLQRQLSGEPLEVQVAASFAAAAMLATEVGPAAAAARRSFLERAWSLSVPGELPYGARLP